ncbi:MAG: hypothetical protein WCG98_05260 [bacterium]
MSNAIIKKFIDNHRILMQDIRQREEKIQAKRMQTPWRDFVKELGSRGEFVLYKNQ